MTLIAFDGTSMVDETDNRFDSNVVNFVKAYVGDTFYQEGVGTDGWLDRIFGGLFGSGGKSKVRKAIKHLKKKMPNPEASQNHKLDVIGCSRGAALAIDFCHEVEKLGYEVRCLMLLDTVASFGIPGNKINLTYDLSTPSNCEHIFHAMAMNERRKLFPLTRLKGASEVWFKGYHSDIIGGNGNVGLNAVSLDWILERAILAGVPLDEDKVIDAVRAMDKSAKPIAPLDLIESENSRSRRILIGDKVN